MYPEKEVENWRCNGVYGKKARYHFTAGKRPEEELKAQFAFEESLVENYESSSKMRLRAASPGALNGSIAGCKLGSCRSLGRWPSECSHYPRSSSFIANSINTICCAPAH